MPSKPMGRPEVPDKKVALPVRIKESLKNRFKKIVSAEKTTPSEAVENLIEKYCNSKEGKPRVQKKTETTGLITG